MRRATCVVAVLLLCIIANAEVPRVLSYQGVLRDASGNPVSDGTYSVAFSIYDVSSGGTALWSETQSVSVADGLLDATLGATTQLDIDFDADYWLGISVEGEPELTPRVRLTAAPYAVRASLADTVAGLGEVALPFDGTGSLGNAPLFKVTNQTATGSAVYGMNEASARFGCLGGEQYGVYGERTLEFGATQGHLGGTSYGAYGKLDAGFGVYRYGYLGGSDYGVYGEYDGGMVGGSVGGLAGAYGAYGYSESPIGGAKWGYLGGAYGVYGTSSGSGYAAVFEGDVTAFGTTTIDDVLVLEPRADLPSPASEGMMCVVGTAPDVHLYVYLNESWRQLDPVGK